MYIRPFHYPEDQGGVKPKELSMYRIRVIITPGDLFWRTLVIFGEKSSKITVFLDENVAKLTRVRSPKMPKFNRMPAFYWRGYGI